MKSIILASAFALLGTTVSCFDYKTQCDSRWGPDNLGDSSSVTICQQGGAVTSLAMLLDDCDQDLYGFDVNPGSLNRWLRENDCFNNGIQIQWGCTDKLTSGVKFVTVASNQDTIRNYLDRGDVALLRVTDEPHYVLGYGYTGTTYYVLDPRGQRRSYKTSEVIGAAIYTRPYWCKD